MHGVAIWSSEAWRTAALEWIDDQGVERTGEAEQPHLRPWATVLRVPTRNGPLWFKACSADTAFEAALYELLTDLHPWNVLTGGRFYDWGDAVVAHPFAVALVPLGFLSERLERARDAYLEVFSDRAPHAELVADLELACRVAKIARALIWERALRSSRDQGETIEPRFATAPLETLAGVLDESFVGRF